MEASGSLYRRRFARILRRDMLARAAMRWREHLSRSRPCDRRDRWTTWPADYIPLSPNTLLKGVWSGPQRWPRSMSPGSGTVGLTR